MKIVLAFVFSVFFLPLQELSEVREHYTTASKSKPLAEKFYLLVSKYKGENPTLLAYKGAGIALKSKFESNKKFKKELFIEGVTLVENALKRESQNIEIRLVRLSIQENTPKFLKYKSNITQDKMLILTAYEKQSEHLKRLIQRYVKQSAVFTETEKQQILK